MKRILFALAGVVLAGGLATTAFTDQHQLKDPNVVVWFEVPVADMTRAMNFYGTILGITMELKKDSAVPMAFFPMNQNYGSAGALIQMPELRPGADGTVIYLNGGDDLQVILDRVGPAGGQVVVEKSLISKELGYFAIFKDTEGNRLGLFSKR